MRNVPSILPLLLLCAPALAHENRGAPPPLAPAAPPAAIARPPPPPGVTDLDFSEFFGPVGRRGLEYGPKVRALEGKLVRISGYMVEQDEPVPGMFLLAARRYVLHQKEYGLADDLPAALLHVIVPEPGPVTHTPGPMLLTGTLELGPREEPDGRISVLRLRLLPREHPLSRPVPAAGSPEVSP